jgi:hypothetical protein
MSMVQLSTKIAEQGPNIIKLFTAVIYEPL